MVEIDILSECKHPKIVGLHEAFYFDSQLWVHDKCFFFVCNILYFIRYLLSSVLVVLLMTSY